MWHLMLSSNYQQQWKDKLSDIGSVLSCFVITVVRVPMHLILDPDLNIPVSIFLHGGGQPWRLDEASPWFYLLPCLNVICWHVQQIRTICWFMYSLLIFQHSALSTSIRSVLNFLFCAMFRTEGPPPLLTNPCSSAHVTTLQGSVPQFQKRVLVRHVSVWQSAL